MEMEILKNMVHYYIFKRKSWFVDYVTKWGWYNSDDGENENDFLVEDVLYRYTKRVNVAE